jgi:hypothetical protein
MVTRTRLFFAFILTLLLSVIDFVGEPVYSPCGSVGVLAILRGGLSEVSSIKSGYAAHPAFRQVSTCSCVCGSTGVLIST